MREIEFRGKRYEPEEWVEGGIMATERRGKIEPLIITWAFNVATPDWIKGLIPPFHYVKPETVGQYTGLKDKNGVKIFEGDIVRSTSCMDETGFGEVYFDSGEWLIGFYGDEQGPLYHLQDCEKGPTLEVIGNIHDNDIEEFVNA
jgi:uncharacterized phage protein (TIGR01671 family)